MSDRQRWTGRWLVVGVLAAASPGLMACGTDDDTITDPPPEPATSTPSSAPSSDVLVELATSGGEDGQGIGDLTVSPDGEAQLHDRQGSVETATLSPDELAALVAALEDADFAGAPAEPDIDDVCPDALVYTVTYQQWEVTADTCTIPDELAPVFDELQTILTGLT